MAKDVQATMNTRTAK